MKSTAMERISALIQWDSYWGYLEESSPLSSGVPVNWEGEQDLERSREKNHKCRILTGKRYNFVDVLLGHNYKEALAYKTLCPF